MTDQSTPFSRQCHIHLGRRPLSQDNRSPKWANNSLLKILFTSSLFQGPHCTLCTNFKPKFHTFWLSYSDPYIERPDLSYSRFHQGGDLLGIVSVNSAFMINSSVSGLFENQHLTVLIKPWPRIQWRDGSVFLSRPKFVTLSRSVGFLSTTTTVFSFFHSQLHHSYYFSHIVKSR